MKIEVIGPLEDSIKIRDYNDNFDDDKSQDLSAMESFMIPITTIFPDSSDDEDNIFSIGIGIVL